jgi:integrase
MARISRSRVDEVGPDATTRDSHATFSESVWRRTWPWKDHPMTVRKRVAKTGESRLFIEIRYKTADGRKRRFRRDAQLQTRSGAQAEERRLIAELERSGSIEQVALPEVTEPPLAGPTFLEAVRHFRATKVHLLKPSTRITYNERIERVLLPRFGEMELGDITGVVLATLDGELTRKELTPSTRRNVHIVLRSIIRAAVEGGLIEAMPRFPRLPRVGRKAIHPMHRDDLNAILAVASVRARLAFALAAFAGLRAGEVRGLKWSDVDLKGNTITVRCSVTRGESAAPKSGDHRVIPIAEPLRELLLETLPTRKSPWALVALTAKGKAWGEYGLNQVFQRAQKRAGRQGCSFHDLRHFFVTELFRRGASAPAVQKLAGHADLATTQRYADMVASDLRATIALFGGNSGATVNREVVGAS